MIESLIKDSLIKLNTATQPREQREDPAAQAAQITREIDTLDALFAEHRRSLHPQLAHFLVNRSYAKALAFLGGETGGIPETALRKNS